MRDVLQEFNTASQIFVAGVTVICTVAGGFLGYAWPDLGADRRYDLVQIDGPESDVIAYDQSATNCAVKLEELRKAGIRAVCEVAP